MPSRKLVKKPSGRYGHENQFHQPSGRVRHHEDPMQFHERGVGKDERQGTQQPNGKRQFDVTTYRLKT